jgi:hypothetical protein
LTTQQQADYASVHRAGGSPAIHDKMMHGDALSVGDIIALSNSGVSDAVVTRYIRDNHTVYNLSRRDIARLQQGGVSQSVIDFMEHSGYRSPDSPWGP